MILKIEWSWAVILANGGYFKEAQMYSKIVLICSTQGLLPAVEEKHLTAAHIKRLFIFAVMWSGGALLELEDRAKMEVFLKKHNAKLDLPRTQGDQTIFEFVVSATGEWDLWSTRVRLLFVKYNVMIFYYSHMLNLTFFWSTSSCSFFKELATNRTFINKPFKS